MAMAFDAKEYMREYNRADYEWFKAHGICTRCRKERAEPHRTMCFDCLEYGRKRASERRMQEEIAERHAQACRDRYYRLKASGICVKCGKNPIYKNFVFCSECYCQKKRFNARAQQERSQHYRERGLCIRCGGDPLEGRSVCAKCMRSLQELANRNFAPFRAENAKRWSETWGGISQRAGSASESTERSSPRSVL